MQFLVAIKSTLSRITRQNEIHITNISTLFNNLSYRITVHNGIKRSLD